MTQAAPFSPRTIAEHPRPLGRPSGAETGGKCWYEAPRGPVGSRPFAEVSLSDELDTAKRYRQHAEELRIIAAADRTGQNRDALEKIAWDYDRMAETMEAIHRTYEGHRKPGMSD